MIGLEPTSWSDRYEEQASAATHLIENRCTEQSTGFVSTVVLVELVWVLAASYEYGKDLIVAVVRQILRTTEFTVEDGDVVCLRVRDWQCGFCRLPDRPSQPFKRLRRLTLDHRAAKGRYFTLVACAQGPCRRPAARLARWCSPAGSGFRLHAGIDLQVSVRQSTGPLVRACGERATVVQAGHRDDWPARGRARTSGPPLGPPRCAASRRPAPA